MRGAKAGAVGAAVLLASEWAHRWAYRRLRRPSSGAGGSEVIVVLGYPARRNGAMHPVQRWRCQIAVRSIDPKCPTTLVFTGAAQGERLSEAAVMAAWAKSLGVGGARIVIEEQARSTWENLEKTMGPMAAAERIKIASDPMHALRASRYLQEMAPDLAGRLVAAETYRRWEHPLLKLAVGLYEGLARVRSLYSG